MRILSCLLVTAGLFAVAPLAGQSTATVSTSGTGQRVLVDQSRSTGWAASIEQVGAAGGVIATQTGSGADLRLTMRGDNQEHDIAQTSAGSALVVVNALGDRNSSAIVQDVAAAGQGEILLLQTGADNRAELSQTTDAAGYNSMTLNQLGDRNIARLTQVGSANTVDLTQNGSGLDATVSQQGNNLSFAMTQTGTNTPITITQTR